MPLESAEVQSGVPLRSGIAPRRLISRLPQIWRIATLGLSLGLMLAGCATVDKVKGWFSPAAAPQQPAVQQQQPAPPPPVAAAPRARRPVHEAHEYREPERVASIDPNSLIGLEPAAVERLLGAPSRVSKGDPSLVWTYAAAGCSFQIFFYPDLKTSSFHALKYGGADGKGDQLDASHSCIRNILTAKSNGPG